MLIINVLCDLVLLSLLIKKNNCGENFDLNKKFP